MGDKLRGVEHLNQEKYLELIVQICLKHLQGKAAPIMKQQFVIENSGVNVSSCEFIEHLLINLEDNIQKVPKMTR